ncbi:type IV pilus modification protein PilV [Halomonas alkalicola]|jgi:type IV pilus assembly protein PilV|uniref:Type IV pilus modification protein PilV n=1 Tax=Halomonas alkalicola TaxID=1930622 RepID=A0ABY9H1Z0_9GAMM|nr:type IV pilus modification protein PilV [Halomonas alkalicola]WLI72479.1 type IV pilus modification protein PilV [Halomonas alkalicola]
MNAKSSKIKGRGLGLRHQSESGFTLIEAMIALLVLTVGLLGVAAMQLKALQGAHAAYQRSIASLAAQDAQERLWEAMAAAGNRQCPDEDVVNGTGEGSWLAQWSQFLPELNDTPVEPRPGCEFIITVAWDEERFEGGGEAFTYTVRLPGSAP